MFGKDQQDVVTDEDVGNIVAEIHNEEVDYDMARDSEESTCRTQDKK